MPIKFRKGDQKDARQGKDLTYAKNRSVVGKGKKPYYYFSCIAELWEDGEKVADAWVHFEADPDPKKAEKNRDKAARAVFKEMRKNESFSFVTQQHQHPDTSGWESEIGEEE